MKNYLKVLIFVFLLFGIVGCTGTSETTTTTTTAVTTTDADPVILGVEDVSVIRKVATFDVLDGITVMDNEDGDLTSSIVVTGEVDTTVVGEYPITVSVTDSNGNEVSESFVVSVYVGDDEAVVLLDLATVDLSGDFVLPSKGPNGSTFIWRSNRVDVITNKGYVIPPGIGCDPVTVTMSARINYGTFSEYYYFDVVVQPNVELSGPITSVSVPFEGTSEEYLVPSQESVDLFFIDGGNVPYIDVETYIRLINGAIQSDIIDVTPVGEDGLAIAYEIEYEDFDGSMKTDSFEAYFDFTLNTFTVNNFGFFENYVAETTSDYGEGLNYLDADYVDGQAVTIPLGFYNFDILIDDSGETTNYLVPFHVANLLFAGGVYYDVYYNGEKLWGIDTFTISGGEEEDLLIQNQIRTSSYNTQTIPEDVRWATYNFLALTFDYFYGLRYEYEVDSFYEILSVQAKDMIMAYSDVGFYRQVFEAAYNRDDLHTSYGFTGFYEAPFEITLYQNDLGPGTLDFYEGYWHMQDLLDTKYGSYENLPEFSVIDEGKTAVIYLTGFDIDTPDSFKEILDSLDSTVENVVIDLSYNTGGNLGAVLRIFGYMTENPILYHSWNPADDSAVTYYIESDYVAYDYEWYIVTSSVTFSAANFMAAMAKEQGIATIVGLDSSGGASSIGVVMTPDGSSLIISTNNVLCTRIGNETEGYQYISIEDGVPVEYSMYNPTSDSLLITTIETAATEE
ncbi:MAG: DUF5011 domain-containing protein [Firmicutes bacterium]|nr:DUF5011 domain-containing protein [Bacillota bacterium]